MKLIINNEIHYLDVTTIEDVIDHFSLERDRAVILLNDEVLKDNKWSITKLNDNDQLELLEFVGGG